MQNQQKSFFSTIIELSIISMTFFICDFVWILFIMWDRYNEILYRTTGQKLGIMSLKFIPAVFSYMALILGNYYFVTSRLGKKFDLWNILSLSIPFGMCTFAIYDFTTAVVFKEWDLITCFMDTIFGGFVHSAAAIAVSYFRDVTSKEDLHSTEAHSAHANEAKY